MYKQALEYKAKEDWDNYLICLLESDEIEANKELHLFYRDTKWKSKTNLTHILPTIQKLIDKNNNEAQYLLGYMYHYGIIVKENYEKAIHYYTLSANQGHSSGQNNLGYMYHYGLGIEQNYEKAIYYYTLSANQGYASAQNNLGIMYYDGRRVEQNYEKAIHYFTLSANQGAPNAQCSLGVLYHNGNGVEKNNEKAIHYYTLSANKGNPHAQNNLKLIPKIEKIKYYSKIEKEKLIIENELLKKEVEELKTHIHAMPDGKLYIEAKSHYDNIR